MKKKRSQIRDDRGPVVVEKVTVTELKGKLSDYIDEARTKGRTVIITRHGDAVATLSPIGESGEQITVRAVSDRIAETRRPQTHTKGTQRETGKRRRPATGRRTPAAQPAGWEDLERAAARIRKHWPEGVSAEDALHDIRG